MKTIIISYTLTGNNGNLAKSLAATLPADHVSIVESKRRTMATIAFDMIFDRTPKIAGLKIEDHDMVIFVGPVWMGYVASPFRACFRQLRPSIGRYVFVSISGGADGDNPKLAADLRKRLGKDPVAVIDMHITDLLPSIPKPARQDTSSYRLKEKDIKHLTDAVGAALRKTMTR